MTLGDKCRRVLGTAVLTSAVFLLPLGAQAATAHDATAPALAWANGGHHHGGHDDNGDDRDECRRHDHGHHRDGDKHHRDFRDHCEEDDD